MNFVEPIRDRAKIEAIKKVLSQNPRDLLLFTLGINSALRVSDLLSLRIDGVVGEGGKPQKFLEIREKKTGKLKRFEINQSVRKALRRYLGESKARREDFLFKSREGDNRPITRQQAHRILSSAARDVGITDRIGTHTLRKTFGYHALKAGVSLPLLQPTFLILTSDMSSSDLPVTKNQNLSALQPRVNHPLVRFPLRTDSDP